MGLEIVEMSLCWEGSLGVKIPDKAAISIGTPNNAVEILSKLVGASHDLGICLTQRAFHSIRRDLVTNKALARCDVSLQTKLSNGFLGIGKRTVQNAVIENVALNAKDLLFPHERWTKTQVRSVVFNSISHLFAIKNFDGNARFYEDLGLG